MSQQENDERVQPLIAGLAALSLTPTTEQVVALLRHLDLVAEANLTMNLTRIEPASALAMHVLDSLACIPEVNAAPPGWLVDLGAGAGFPGIPLALMTGSRLTLVESRGKKAGFLERAVADLRLEATVLGVRAEEAVDASGDAYAVAVARALSALPSLVELAAPLLGIDGVLICLKGSPAEAELASGARAAALCGMIEIDRRKVEVPGLDAARMLVSYRKATRPKVKLPRRPGLAQRQPLA